MATADEYAQWIVANADKKGTPEFDTVAKAYQLARQPAASPAKSDSESSFLSSVGKGLGNLAAGAVRGAGSIGATLLLPADMVNQKLRGEDFFSLKDNKQRRNAIDSGLQALGADPDSILYGAGKLGGEIAGTAGVGSVLAPAARVLGAAPSVVNAVRTAGMTTGAPVAPGLANLGANMLARTAGGGITGAASAGLVNPSDAGSGAVVGAVAPSAFAVVGKASNALGRVLNGPEVTPAVQAGVNAAQSAGYVIPPTQAKPNLLNRLLEGASGKITTAQNASARNQQVTNSLAADTLGLPKDTQITKDVLNNVRNQAGQAYEAVKTTGTITPGTGYEQALENIIAPARKAAAGFPNATPNPIIGEIESLKSPQFDASSAVEKISELREKATSAYASGDKTRGKALKAAADVLEDTIDQHLQQIGAPADLLQGFRNARQLIAKTYSVEKALNPTSGTVDAQKLAAQLSKGKPLSGGLLKAAEFAQMFPKAAQPVEKMGSLPQLSPLDWAASGATSAATGNPLMLAGILARPALRSLALSPVVQNRLGTASGQSYLQRLAASPEFAQLAYRSAPLAADR